MQARELFAREVFPVAGKASAHLFGRRKFARFRAAPQEDGHFYLLFRVRRSNVAPARQWLPGTALQLHPILSLCHGFPPEKLERAWGGRRKLYSESLATARVNSF